jgi:hypothetical protein
MQLKSTNSVKSTRSEAHRTRYTVVFDRQQLVNSPGASGRSGKLPTVRKGIGCLSTVAQMLKHTLSAETCL